MTAIQLPTKNWKFKTGFFLSIHFRNFDQTYKHLKKSRHHAAHALALKSSSKI